MSPNVLNSFGLLREIIVFTKSQYSSFCGKHTTGQCHTNWEVEIDKPFYFIIKTSIAPCCMLAVLRESRRVIPVQTMQGKKEGSDGVRVAGGIHGLVGLIHVVITSPPSPRFFDPPL